MADVEISIDPAAFGATGALTRAYKVKDPATGEFPIPLRASVRIPLGKDNDFRTSGAGGMPIAYSSGIANDPATSVGDIVITVNVATMNDIQVNRLGQFFKNSLADLISKAIIIVKIGGVTQTAAQIMALPLT